MSHVSDPDVYLDVLHQVGAGRLHNALKRFYKDVSSADFHHRLTGEDSKILGWHYMDLINCLCTGDEIHDFPLVVLAFEAQMIRETCSIFTRINITDGDLLHLEESVTLYFNCKSLLHRVNLTDWTLRFVIPFHTREIYEEFEVGLGIVSMQGREAKHKKLHDYYLRKWECVFRHEFAELILEKENSAKDTYHRKDGKFVQPEKEKIIKSKFRGEPFCYCGTLRENCKICSSEIVKEIQLACTSQDLSNLRSRGVVMVK